MSTRILITGGAGFLGTALAGRLIGCHRIVLLDNLLRNAVKHTDLLEHPQVNLVRADVLDSKKLEEALQDCWGVVHLASVAGVDAVEADPVGCMRTTLLGTDNLLRAACRVKNLQRVVLVSSSEVYGPNAHNVTEAQADVPCEVGAARWSYAAGKLAAEHLGLGYHAQFGLPVCVARPFNAYGPGQVGQGAVHTLVKRALSNEPLELHNGGGQVRAWCYVDDMVRGLEQLLFESAAVGGVFNLGNPECVVTTAELAGKIGALTGSQRQPVSVCRPGPEVDFRVPDISKARRLIGFRPQVGLDEGLALTVDWYRSRAR